MKRNQPDTACWHQHYGLWPGQTLALFAAESRWIFLSTNTLPFYYVCPRLENQFPSAHMNTHATDFDSPLNHWLHEEPNELAVWKLANRMSNWLRWYDGCNVLLANKTEVGWYHLPDRGFDIETNTRHGEYIPEHVHHNYLHSDVYERSRAERGVEGARPGQFLPKGQFSDESKW